MYMWYFTKGISSFVCVVEGLNEKKFLFLWSLDESRLKIIYHAIMIDVRSTTGRVEICIGGVH